MNEKKILGFDLPTIAAIVLTGLVFFGWQTYMAKKYPQMNRKAEVVANKEATPVEQEKTVATEQSLKQETKGVTTAVDSNQPEQIFNYESADTALKITSYGMGFKDVVLHKQKDRNHQEMKLGLSEMPVYALSQISATSPLMFNITKIDDNTYEGTALAGQTKITRRLEFDVKTGAIKNSVLVENIDPQFKGLSLDISEAALEHASSGNFLMPALEHQEFILNHENKDERVNNSAAKETINKEYKQVSLLALGSQYFTSAVVDKSQVIPEALVIGGKDVKTLSAKLQYKPILGQNSMTLSWVQYSGAKDYARLESIDPLFAKVVDFGMLAAISKFLLLNLKWWHSLVGNWGIAIILLTLLVRIVVLPFNVATFRSTKKMQELQPKVQALRERYKNDPQGMNQAQMQLWKENKVNPLGGCLPMLLQLPIFFALNNVFRQSIELYQAPFFGWITDLSLKDPFFVLPILMGVSMFFQQKITPTTMDPAQAKVMKYMPILFSFMMVGLPSGLTLYIFINTLSGIVLQQAFMGDRNIISAKAVKA